DVVENAVKYPTDRYSRARDCAPPTAPPRATQARTALLDCLIRISLAATRTQSSYSAILVPKPLADFRARCVLPPSKAQILPMHLPQAVFAANPIRNRAAFPLPPARCFANPAKNG